MAGLDYDPNEASQWVKDNVLAHITGPKTPRSTIRDEIEEFCDVTRYGKPEFWGFYSAYDWVAVCQLFGTMMDLPKHWPMYCRDIKQWCDALGSPRLPKNGEVQHHALADARWTKQAWEFLNTSASRRVLARAGG